MEAVQSKKRMKSESGLRANCLPFPEVIAQSIANIAPSASPALFIPAVFAVSGNGSWFTFILSTIAIVLIGYNISHFGSRSASTGALYTYTSKELGPLIGTITGWGLLLAYTLTASAVVCGFANYINVLLESIGFQIPGAILVLIGVASSWFIASKDIKLSAKMMLTFEAISVFFILLLAIVFLIRHGINFDMTQLKLKGVSFSSIKAGLVLAVFCYVGFESSTALGEEAKNPLKTIPKAVIISGLSVGLFFILMAYVEVQGFIGSAVKLNEAEAPLITIAQGNGMGFLTIILTLGAIISFWACVNASVNAGARVLFSMARHKLFHASIGVAHESNDTPHTAVTLISILAFLPTGILLCFGNKLFDVFNWMATLATYGFLLSYILIVVAAPIYLYRLNKLRPVHVVLAAITLVILLVAVVGSVYPQPAFPYNIFPVLFVAWCILGGLWYAIVNHRKPEIASEIRKNTQETYDRFLPDKV